jgi:hypothetical protein
MKNDQLLLSVIEGRPDAPIRIALSFVHPRERIDIPVRDVLMIEAFAEETFFFPELQASKTYPFAHVRLDFKPHVRASIYRLTTKIMEEVLEIVAAGEVICRPVVREPLGIRNGLKIGVYDFEDAKKIAAKLREGWVIPGLRVV